MTIKNVILQWFICEQFHDIDPQCNWRLRRARTLSLRTLNLLVLCEYSTTLIRLMPMLSTGNMSTSIFVHRPEFRKEERNCAACARLSSVCFVHWSNKRNGVFALSARKHQTHYCQMHIFAVSVYDVCVCWARVEHKSIWCGFRMSRGPNQAQTKLYRSSCRRTHKLKFHLNMISLCGCMAFCHTPMLQCCDVYWRHQFRCVSGGSRLPLPSPSWANSQRQQGTARAM